MDIHLGSGARTDDHRVAGQDSATIFERFVHSEAVGSVLLVAATAGALAAANSAWAPVYDAAVHAKLGISVGGFRFALTAQHWINDLLMAVFFFVVGLEIKREVLVGQLSSARLAALPMMAALGGMVVPASCYVWLNAGRPGAAGWGIPMATDIAFALGVLAALGPRVPPGLKVFLAALAIVDDLGAVVVIAAFYAHGLQWTGLAVAAGGLACAAAAGRAGVRSWPFYLLLSATVWAGVFASGVHATVAGVLLAMLVPVGSRESNRGPITADQPPRPLGLVLEDHLHPVVTFVVLPLFAFFNAGVSVTRGPDAAWSGPVAAGVVLGLVFGKPLGVALFGWAAVRLNLAALPGGVRPRQLLGAGCLAGIGFTMSLFIAELAFESAALIRQAKLGILAASISAALLGIVVLVAGTRRSAR